METGVLYEKVKYRYIGQTRNKHFFKWGSMQNLHCMQYVSLQSYFRGPIAHHPSLSHALILFSIIPCKSCIQSH